MNLRRDRESQGQRNRENTNTKLQDTPKVRYWGKKGVNKES